MTEHEGGTEVVSAHGAGVVEDKEDMLHPNSAKARNALRRTVQALVSLSWIAGSIARPYVAAIPMLFATADSLRNLTWEFRRARRLALATGPRFRYYLSLSVPGVLCVGSTAYVLFDTRSSTEITAVSAIDAVFCLSWAFTYFWLRKLRLTEHGKDVADEEPSISRLAFESA